MFLCFKYNYLKKFLKEVVGIHYGKQRFNLFFRAIILITDGFSIN